MVLCCVCCVHATAPTDVIPHANVPAIVGDGFTLDAGFLGENQFASLSFQDTVDGYTPKYRDGQVDPTTGLPTSCVQCIKCALANKSLRSLPFTRATRCAGRMRRVCLQN